MSLKLGFETTSDQVAEAYADEIKGKNVLITGTSLNGLGFETARAIAKYANLIIITGYNAGRLQASVDAILKETPTANIRKLTLDLATLASTRESAKEVLAYSEPIHVLINNAAGAIGDYKITVDGFESQFGTNHIAPFLFTNLILPKIKEAKTATYTPRIIFVSSGAHAFGPGVRFDDLKFAGGAEYERWQGYAQAKSANILTASEFSRRLKGDVITFSLHPGLIWTNMPAAVPSPSMIEQGMTDETGKPINGKFTWKTLPQGAATQLVAAFSPDIKDQSGSYLDDCEIHNDRIAPHSSDLGNASKLWALTEELVGQKFTY